MARGYRDEDTQDDCFVVCDEAQALHATEKALKVSLGRHHVDDLEPGVEIWIPLAAVHDDSEVFDPKDQSRGKLIIKTWFARSKGWVE